MDFCKELEGGSVKDSRPGSFFFVFHHLQVHFIVQYGCWSTSAFQAAGRRAGEGQSHHLPAPLEFLHSPHFGHHLITWPCLAAREAGKCLQAAWNAAPDRALLLRKTENGHVGWQLTSNFCPGPWLPSLDLWWGREEVPCPRTEHTEYGIRW